MGQLFGATFASATVSLIQPHWTAVNSKVRPCFEPCKAARYTIYWPRAFRARDLQTIQNVIEVYEYFTGTLHFTCRSAKSPFYTSKDNGVMKLIAKEIEIEVTMQV